MKACLQCDDRDDQLSRIAKSRIEKSAHTLAHTFSQLLGGMPHPPGERQDGERRGDEDQKMVTGREYFQSNRYRNTNEKQGKRPTNPS
jgi:hypothetical protein